MNSAELWIVIVKFLGATFACGLGILALLGSFRDATGKLSKSGVATLVGLILTFIINIIGAMIENGKAQEDAKEQAVRAVKLLTEINKTVQPLGQMSMDYSFDLPNSDPVVQQYISYLEKVVFDKKDDWDKVMAPQISGLLFGQKENGEPYSVYVYVDGEFWPKGAMKDIDKMIKGFRPTINFYRTPIEKDKFSHWDESSKISPSLTLISNFKNELPRLTYNRKEKRLTVYGQVKFNDELMNSNGEVFSIPDLYGSQIIISLQSLDISRLPEFSDSSKKYKNFNNSGSVRILKGIRLNNVAFRFGGGRKFSFEGKDFFVAENGFSMVFGASFPLAK